MGYNQYAFKYSSKGKTKMKKFFGEFKKFITRGNVIDMAVGVIVGGAFTAIVNSMSNNILKPLINWFLALILGKDSLSELYTYLQLVHADDGTIDLANSIYIDWGAFINAIINFIITAFVLFIIVKLMNELKEQKLGLIAGAKKYKFTKEQKKEMKARGINRLDKDQLDAYIAELEARKAELEAAAKAEEDAKAAAERAANPTTEDLLKKIIAILEEK